MIALLKANIYRLWREKTVPAFLIIVAFVTLVWSLGATILVASSGEPSPYSFSSQYLQMVDPFGYLGIIGPLIITTFLGNDWRGGTFRNQVASGWKRHEIYFSSLITSLLICLSMFVTVTLIAILTMVPTGLYPLYLDGSTGTVGQFVVSIVFVLLGYVLTSVFLVSMSFICRNSWAPFLILIGTYLAILACETITDTIWAMSEQPYVHILEWFPTYQNDRFISGLPDTGFNSLFYTGQYFSGRLTAISLKTTFIYLLGIGLFGFLGYWSFRKRDIR